MELKAMLDLWVKITGVNPSEEKKSYTISFSDNLSEWDIEKMDKKITAALSYDKSGYFATVYLSHYFKEYLEKRKLTAYELVTDQVTSGYISDIRTLYQALMENDAEDRIMEEAEKAMKSYGLNCEGMSVFDIVELSTSATKCMDMLTTVQFSTGNTDNAGFKASKEVYLCKSIGDVVTNVQKGILNGVVLVYIREEDLESSYFAFVIKNGDNLYLVTDKPKYAHPAQKFLTRCPGRNMGDRINSAYFPYSLTNIDTQDMHGSGRYAVREKDERLSSASENGEPVRLGSFVDMTKEEAFWTLMMLSLIKEKFYDNHYQCKEISYVGNMIRHPALAMKANELALYNELPKIDLAEIKNPETLEMEYDIEPKHLYDYIVDRFKDKVSSITFDGIGVDTKSLTDKDMEKFQVLTVDSKKDKILPFSVNDFGTEDDLRYRQKWIARYNMALEIQKLNHNEFIANVHFVEDVFLSMIKARCQDLIKLAVRGEICQDLVQTESFDSWLEYHAPGNEIGNEEAYARKDYRCNVTGKPPKVVLKISPKNANDLAFLAGVPLERLPEQLQHWSKGCKPYGNYILRNADPFDWVIKDEYDTRNFDLYFFLSGRAYNELKCPSCYKRSILTGNCLAKTRRVQNETGDYVQTITKKCSNCKWRTKPEE